MKRKSKLKHLYMINYLLAGLLGVTFFFLGQANETRKDFKAAGNQFVPIRFLKDELISISLHLVAVLILAITVNEWSIYSPTVQKYITCIFALGGIIGPWLISLISSSSKKYIRRIVDIKTNVSAKVIGETTTVKETIAKAEQEGITVAPTPK